MEKMEQINLETAPKKVVAAEAYITPRLAQSALVKAHNRKIMLVSKTRKVLV